MIRRSVSFLLVVLMVFSFVSVTAADEWEQAAYSKVPTTGTPSKTPGYAGGKYVSTEKSGLIGSFENSLYEQSDRYLRMYANTFTDYACDEIGYDIFLQKWDGYYWITQSPYYTKTEYDDDYVYGYHYKSVSVGYYRVHTYHSAEEGVLSDIESIYSSYISVD